TASRSRGPTRRTTTQGPPRHGDRVSVGRPAAAVIPGCYVDQPVWLFAARGLQDASDHHFGADRLGFFGRTGDVGCEHDIVQPFEAIVAWRLMHAHVESSSGNPVF